MLKIFTSKRVEIEPGEDTGTFPDGYFEVQTADSRRNTSPRNAHERDYGALRQATEVRHGFA
ncbi:hypothetical protein [Rhizobium sp. RAF56]|jgi:hypothetical protein|uniref:hypothetical protein n=1 Tax=Rhizobium sp. RAF56 TaxID=3233062 RepID=UPI003F94594F